MAKQVITVPDAVEGIRVDLWGVEFDVVPPTKSLAKKAERHVLAMVEAETNDELVDAIGGFFDLKLIPLDRRRTRPSTIIRRRWDDDKVSIPQLQALAERLRDAERPI